MYLPVCNEQVLWTVSVLVYQSRLVHYSRDFVAIACLDTDLCHDPWSDLRKSR